MKKLYIFAFLLTYCSMVVSQEPVFTSKAIHHPVVGANGMAASQHNIATDVGIQILEKGGNAIDAAVAIGFTLAVVLPRAGNLGGGFMLYHDSMSDLP